MQQARERTRKAKLATRATRAAAKRVKARAMQAKASASQKKKELAAWPAHFTPADLGQGKEKDTKASVQARVAFLNRLRVRAPPLPPDMEALWDPFVEKYVRRMRSLYEKAVGVRMVEQVNKVRAGLGDYLLQEDGSVAVPSGSEPMGDKGYFEKWFRKNWLRLPKGGEVTL